MGPVKYFQCANSSAGLSSRETEVQYSQLSQNQACICEKPTQSSFTNCNAVVVYNTDEQQALYVHIRPPIFECERPPNMKLINQFLNGEGKKIAMIFGRTLWDATSDMQRCLDQQKIDCQVIKLPITQKLKEARWQRRVDLSWILKVHPEDGKIILEDAAQEQPIEYSPKTTK